MCSVIREDPQHFRRMSSRHQQRPPPCKSNTAMKPSETVAIQTSIVQNKSSAISSANIASSTIPSWDMESKNIGRTTLV
uniref:Uncharacterized protein n=1 Tax=Megaselia scalaris TaxID=36166 RepID=T1GAV8_MEGSC